MDIERSRPLSFIMRRETILSVFVVSAILSTLLGESGAHQSTTLLTVMALVVFPLLAWFTHKRQLLATWCTILVLIMYGSGFLHDSFVSLTDDNEANILVLILKGLAGIYLTWGALILHRERHVRD